MSQESLQILLQSRVDTGLRTLNYDGIVYVTFATFKGQDRQQAAQTLRRWRNKYQIRGFGYHQQNYGVKLIKYDPNSYDQ